MHLQVVNHSGIRSCISPGSSFCTGPCSGGLRGPPSVREEPDSGFYQLRANASVLLPSRDPLLRPSRHAERGLHHRCDTSISCEEILDRSRDKQTYPRGERQGIEDKGHRFWIPQMILARLLGGYAGKRRRFWIQPMGSAPLLATLKRIVINFPFRLRGSWSVLCQSYPLWPERVVMLSILILSGRRKLRVPSCHFPNLAHSLAVHTKS